MQCTLVQGDLLLHIFVCAWWLPTLCRAHLHRVAFYLEHLHGHFPICAVCTCTGWTLTYICTWWFPTLYSVRLHTVTCTLYTSKGWCILLYYKLVHGDFSVCTLVQDILLTYQYRMTSHSVHLYTVTPTCQGCTNKNIYRATSHSFKLLRSVTHVSEKAHRVPSTLRVTSNVPAWPLTVCTCTLPWIPWPPGVSCRLSRRSPCSPHPGQKYETGFIRQS